MYEITDLRPNPLGFVVLKSLSEERTKCEGGIPSPVSRMANCAPVPQAAVMTAIDPLGGVVSMVLTFRRQRSFFWELRLTAGRVNRFQEWHVAENKKGSHAVLDTLKVEG